MVMKTTWLRGGPVVARKDRPDLGASEVGDFTYCARSWWLKRVGGKPATGPQLGEGVEAHGEVGAQLALVVITARIVKLLVIGVVLVTITLLVMLLRH
jgi:hypothetical protein